MTIHLPDGTRIEGTPEECARFLPVPRGPSLMRGINGALTLCDEGCGQYGLHWCPIGDPMPVCIPSVFAAPCLGCQQSPAGCCTAHPPPTYTVTGTVGPTPDGVWINGPAFSGFNYPASPNGEH